ncbi:MAG: C39 family peptidase [Porticoccaceae bacterium]
MSQLLLISSLWAGIIIGLFAYAVPAQAEVHLNLPSAVGSLPIKTWKQLRDADLEKQDLDYSCGSAATATILRSFYGRDIYEKDILDEVVLVGDDGTASFSDLQQAVKKFGFKAIGVSANFEKLKTIKIPAIVYLRYRDKDHFSVIRGINDQGVVWLGDPSWGNRKFTEHQFRDMWETRDNEQLKGKLLLIIPVDKTLATLNQDFFHPPEVNATAIELLTLTSY